MPAPSISPIFPLILLETLRDSDLPEEVLEDEDVTHSLPRRLGLNDVVGSQIRRLQEDVRAGRLQLVEQVVALMQLVVRRPDAEKVFAEAGHRIGRYHWEQRSRFMRTLLRLAPNAVRRIAARRAARRLLRRTVTDGQVAVGRGPSYLRVRAPLSSEVGTDAVCAFYAGAFGEITELHTRKRYRVLHGECVMRGNEACQWTVEVKA